MSNIISGGMKKQLERAIEGSVLLTLLAFLSNMVGVKALTWLDVFSSFSIQALAMVLVIGWLVIVGGNWIQQHFKLPF